MKNADSKIVYLQNFFSESINSDIGFVGVECDSWENFEVCIIQKNFPNRSSSYRLWVKYFSPMANSHLIQKYIQFQQLSGNSC